MSRIFISHSSANNAEAIVLCDWLAVQGWKDEIFLDLDPTRGIAAGERWERKLNEAASRCEAVIFLVSRAWIVSGWCRKELNLAHRLNKRLFGVLIEDLSVDEVPKDLSSEWQLVRLASGRDGIIFRAVLPVTHEEQHVTFSAEGLQRLKHGLEQAGLDGKYFAWPPTNDLDRSPFRGLRPLEADDAGIFFGRDAPIIEALDRLRGLREAAPPRLLVILGASGAGKSSFLRAGLLPRLRRDDRNFLPLPIIRPERAAISGATGLLAALEGAYRTAGLPKSRADLRAAIDGGAATLRPVLSTLEQKATPVPLDEGSTPRPPTLIVSIDQAEELFLAEGREEAEAFLAMLRELLVEDMPALTALFTIRSDNYERLQEAKLLDGIRKTPFDLGPIPKGSYADVIKVPIRRLDGTARAIKIDDALVDALLTDIEAGGAKDALPLLAFTLERLFDEYGASGRLTLDHFNKLGRVKGSIESAVERAFNAADADSRIPRDRSARLLLLRRGLIPWLAGVDPDTKAPRRRVARLSEIPAEARPLIDILMEQRLLSTDVSKDTGEKTIEPAHEALLRQWGLLQGWLSEDTDLLTILDGIKRASRDWAANSRNDSWLVHNSERLVTIDQVSLRSDLAKALEPTDLAYFRACKLNVRRNKFARGRGAIAFQASVSVVGLCVGIISTIYVMTGTSYRATSANNLISLVYERLTRAEMVAESLRRSGNKSDTRRLKVVYDEAYVNWNQNLRMNMFALRDIVTGNEGDTYADLEINFGKSIVDPLRKIDNCITRGYDSYIASGNTVFEFEACHLVELETYMHRCARSFSMKLMATSSVSSSLFSWLDISSRSSQLKSFDCLQ